MWQKTCEFSGFKDIQRNDALSLCFPLCITQEEEHSQQAPELIGANHIQAHIMTGGYSECFEF